MAKRPGTSIDARPTAHTTNDRVCRTAESIGEDLGMSHIRIIIGSALMAGCGYAIASQLGVEPRYQLLMAGFAVGVVLLGQFPSVSLRRRVVALEAKLAGLEASGT